jgi:hypothetical protein
MRRICTAGITLLEIEDGLRVACRNRGATVEDAIVAIVARDSCTDWIKM